MSQNKTIQKNKTRIGRQQKASRNGFKMDVKTQTSLSPYFDWQKIMGTQLFKESFEIRTKCQRGSILAFG